MDKILLLGDSISMGYREYVKENFKDKYEVVYPYENGKMASHLHRMLYEWTQELSCTSENVALVYWNCGLWDVVRIFGEGPHTSAEVYREYIERIFFRLKYLFPCAKICFASTTPILEEKYNSEFYRLNSDIERYNRIAKDTLKNIDVFDDLYSFVREMHVAEKDYKDATHFMNDTSKIIAEHISKIINEVLERTPMKYEKDVHIDSRQTATKILNNKQTVALWGAGKNCRTYIGLIRSFYDVQVIVDKNNKLHGTYIEGIPCISSDELLSNNIRSVIIMIDATSAKESIINECVKNDIEVCEYRDVLNVIYPLYEKDILQDVHFINADPEAKNQMKKYIGINVPAYGCNFNCSYCYLDDKITGKNAFPKLVHYPEYIRYQLRREKVGGTALIGICAYGETLLTDKIVEVCSELLKEGHYLHIVTNGIVTQRITDIIEAAGEYAKHIIFKVSFHYMELKQKNLLDKFVQNINIIEKSDASFTIELMPHDEIVEMIPEILKFSLENFGAYPQLTIGRDEHNNRKLLTSYSIEKYKEIWSVFNSEMFDARMSFYMMHGKNCNAGRDGFFVDLYSGNINRCLFTEGIANLYDDHCDFDFEMVKDTCPLDYCYNCHVYATLGLLPDVDAPTYMTIRDRVREDGSHWIKEDMRRFLDIKLYDINKEVN